MSQTASTRHAQHQNIIRTKAHMLAAKRELLLAAHEIIRPYQSYAEQSFAMASRSKPAKMLYRAINEAEKIKKSALRTARTWGWKS